MKRIILGLLSVALLQACSQSPETLPYLGQAKTEKVSVNGTLKDTTIYQSIPAFEFLNQDSIPVTEKDFKGKIYVADFFFTSCNTICPIMHRNLLKVYEKYKGDPRVKIISHSIDTKYDMPSRLKKYANNLGISGTQWEFVHGSRDSIYNFAAASYLVAAYEDKREPQGLVHQGWFILVDQNRNLRGAYDGTKTEQVDQLLKDMELLLKQNEQ